jgi:hypothetical protein
VIKNGVPFDVAHALEDWELIAYTVVFGQFENGNKEWDWDSMSFIDRG